MRVLVVDDDADIALMLARMLTHLGYSPVACSDPAEAIQQHALGDFDIVISDYMMHPDGIEVLRAFPNAFCILLTASYANAAISQALRDRVIHLVLTKPATIADLSAALGATPTSGD